jgi:HPt (histidine-containing phosphotransfer) domain-containing protein
MAHGEAGAGAAQAPLVDRSALDPIMKVTGAAVMRRIIDAFWSEANSMTGALTAAIESGERENIRKAAHALKGAASNVGAGRTARIAATMEKCDQAQARALMPALEQALEETRPALDDVLRDAA